MSNARPQHSGLRPFRHHLNPTTLLLVEQLEDRLVLSVAPGNAVPGELLIRFQPGVTHAAVLDFYAGHGLSEFERLHDLRAACVGQIDQIGGAAGESREHPGKHVIDAARRAACDRGRFRAGAELANQVLDRDGDVDGV